MKEGELIFNDVNVLNFYGWSLFTIAQVYSTNRDGRNTPPFIHCYIEPKWVVDYEREIAGMLSHEVIEAILVGFELEDKRRWLGEYNIHGIMGAISYEDGTMINYIDNKDGFTVGTRPIPEEEMKKHEEAQRFYNDKQKSNTQLESRPEL